LGAIPHIVNLIEALEKKVSSEWIEFDGTVFTRTDIVFNGSGLLLLHWEI
jgi:hypothetical protein